MKVKFLQDFRGRETHEVFYRAGDVGEIEPRDLVERVICEPVREEPKPETRPTAPATKKGKTK